MLFGGGLVGILYIAFLVWAVFDVISTDESMVRNLPKLPWLFIVIIFNPIGGLAWLLLGRPENAGFRPGDTSPRRRFNGPEDGPLWAVEEARKARYADMDEELDRRIEEKRLKEWEEELRRREAELDQRGEEP